MRVKALILGKVMAPKQVRDELGPSHPFGGTQQDASCFLSSGHAPVHLMFYSPIKVCEQGRQSRDQTIWPLFGIRTTCAISDIPAQEARN